jgi:nucleoside-diphosphate-sugar epimerase
LANQVTTSTGKTIVGVIGATSLVGNYLIPLLVDAGWRVVAFTRNGMEARRRFSETVDWRTLPVDASGGTESIPLWICLAPIWVLPHYFPMLEQAGTRRIVALSSTSRFTKRDSADEGERLTAELLEKGEECLWRWAGTKETDWVILRPTMVYDLKNDGNITALARIIQRFGFFPLVGRAQGLRQPVHAEDVACACRSALEKPGIINRVYTLSGGETLSYRDMICRISTMLDRPVRVIQVPVGLFRLLVAVIRCFPRYRNWNVSMAERMNIDMNFDNTEAIRDLNFSPRGFL